MPNSTPILQINHHKIAGNRSEPLGWVRWSPSGQSPHRSTQDNLPYAQGIAEAFLQPTMIQVRGMRLPHKKSRQMTSKSLYCRAKGLQLVDILNHKDHRQSNWKVEAKHHQEIACNFLSIFINYSQIPSPGFKLKFH